MGFKDPARNREYAKQYYAKPENRAKKKLYAKAHLAEMRIATAKWRANNPEYGAAADRIRRFKLTPDHIEWLLLAQGGNCLVCSKPLGKKFHVDHDHKTGAIRGLLHGVCNRMLGMAYDDTGILHGAIEYLQENKEIKNEFESQRPQDRQAGQRR